MHILVIEDEEQLCCSIAEGLRLNGYETDTCFDGNEGLELCLTENYDLILLDEWKEIVEKELKNISK